MSKTIFDPSQREDARFTKFMCEAIQDYLACMRPVGDDLFYRHYGEGGAKLFWDTFQFGTRSLSSFCRTMAQLKAEDFHKISVWRGAYEQAMLKAVVGGEGFFRGQTEQLATVTYYHQIKAPELTKVVVREAIDWLFKNPWERHLLPDSLVAVIAPSQVQLITAPATEPILPGSRKRGPRPTLRHDIKARMLADLRSGTTTLDRMQEGGDTEECLVTTYGGSRETCRKARAEAVAEFVGNPDFAK